MASVARAHPSVNTVRVAPSTMLGFLGDGRYWFMPEPEHIPAEGYEPVPRLRALQGTR